VNLLEKAGTIFDRIIDALAGRAGVLVIGIMLVMCYEVVMRYFLNRPPAWAVEVCEYMLYLLAFLGAAWLLKLGGHVRVDIVLGRLNPKAQTWLNIATSAIGVIICLVIAWYGGESTIDHFQRGIPVVKTLKIPKAPLLAVIAVGCFLLSIQFLRQTYGYVRSWGVMAKKEQR